MLRLISANRLTDGVVVYWGTDARWVETFAEGAVFDDAATSGAEAFDAAMARAKGDEKANVVVDVVPVEAVRAGAVAKPAHIREAIRAAGPTVHRDHGKQAGDARRSV
jgi:hypothetical protein